MWVKIHNERAPRVIESHVGHLTIRSETLLHKYVEICTTEHVMLLSHLGLTTSRNSIPTRPKALTRRKAELLCDVDRSRPKGRKLSARHDIRVAQGP